MAIPGRFDSNIPTSNGIVEAKTIKTDSNQIDVDNLINAYIDFRKYIIDQDTLSKVAFIENNVLKDFAGTFSLDFDQYPNQIKEYINLYVDTSTGYVTYNTDTETGVEIKISNAVYNENKVLKDVENNVLLDINELESNVNNVNLSYDADNDQILDGGNNLLIDKVSEINSEITDLENKYDSISMKYDSTDDKIIDYNDNDLLTGVTSINSNIDSLNEKVDTINLKYDSTNDKITDYNDNDLLTDVSNINTSITDLENKYDSIGMKYDSGKITDLEGTNVYLDIDVVNDRISNTKNEIIYNIVQDATNGLSTEIILDPNSAFAFAQNSDNTKQVDVSIDTSKLTISNMSVNLTAYNTDDTDAIYIVTYKNITKDENGNITGFSIVAYDLSGNQLDTFSTSMIVKLA